MMTPARRLILLTGLLCVVSLPAAAEPFAYQPDSCEFKASFPEKPVIEEKCTTSAKKVCSEVVSYTKVVSAETSVNFRLTCAQLENSELKRYTTEIMKETLKQMLADSSLDTGSEIQSLDKDGYKIVAATTTGVRGDRDVIYTGQIWVGQKTLFTLEGDMTGPQNAAADLIFSNILRDITHKSEPKAEPVAKTPAKSPAKPKP